MVINILTMTKVIASYVKLLFFPIILNADYHVIPETSAMRPPFSLLCSLVDLHRINYFKALQQAKRDNLFYSVDIHYVDTGYEHYADQQYYG